MVTKKIFDKTAKRLKKKRTRHNAFGEAIEFVVTRLRPKTPMDGEEMQLWCEFLGEQISDNESLMALWLIYVCASPLKKAEELPELWSECVIIWGKYLMGASPRKSKARFIWTIFWKTIDGREPIPDPGEYISSPSEA